MFCSRTLEHSQIPKCIKTGHFTTLERTQIAISSVYIYILQYNSNI